MVLRWADEFPGLRGWSKSDDAATAWASYRHDRSAKGAAYTQFILPLDGTPIGESFFAPLPDKFSFGRWEKRPGVSCLMGDIKLTPSRWGSGLATQGMQQIVPVLFGDAPCDLLVVPPNVLHNPAAVRAYEKAGFRHTEMRTWHGHKIMELSRDRFQDLYVRDTRGH